MTHIQRQSLWATAILTAMEFFYGSCTHHSLFEVEYFASECPGNVCFLRRAPFLLHLLSTGLRKTLPGTVHEMNRKKERVRSGSLPFPTICSFLFAQHSLIAYAPTKKRKHYFS